MKKIGFVIGTMRCGGAQRVVSVLSKYFYEKLYMTDIITTSDDILEYSLQEGIRYIPLVAKNEKIGIKQIQCIGNLYKWLKKEKYDYVISFLPMTCIYVACCKSLGLKFKFIASERMDPKQDPKNWVLRKIRDYAYSKSDAMVFQTEDAKKYFSKKIQKKSKIIYNPLNVKIPEPEYNNRDERIVTAVRLEKQKNIPMLIEAFSIFLRKNPQYVLEVYGQGTQQYLLEELVKNKGMTNKFIFKGFSSDVYTHIKNAKLFVLSSDYEGVSNSMLEALCMGIPIASTDHPIGGARMFIKNGVNGFLSEVGNAEQLANNMDKIVKLDENKYIEMSKQAYSIKKTLVSEEICKQWEEFITN